jgi:hypothetical protein
MYPMPERLTAGAFDGGGGPDFVFTYTENVCPILQAASY